MFNTEIKNTKIYKNEFLKYFPSKFWKLEKYKNPFYEIEKDISLNKTKWKYYNKSKITLILNFNKIYYVILWKDRSIEFRINNLLLMSDGVNGINIIDNKKIFFYCKNNIRYRFLEKEFKLKINYFLRKKKFNKLFQKK